MRIYFEERTTRIHVGRDSFVHVLCGNRRTKSGHGLISSFEPRICSYCSRPLCAPLIEESLPRLVSAAPKGHSSLDSFISCISQVVPFTPWGISGPERSPFPTLGKLEVAVRSRSWQPLDLAVVFVSLPAKRAGPCIRIIGILAEDAHNL